MTLNYNPSCFPLAEICDGIDNDCDFRIDEFCQILTPTPPVCEPSMREYFDKGDANCDGRTDDLDYVLWWKAFGVSDGGDFDNDGDTDDDDYQVWLAHYGE